MSGTAQASRHNVKTVEVGASRVQAWQYNGAIVMSLCGNGLIDLSANQARAIARILVDQADTLEATP